MGKEARVWLVGLLIVALFLIGIALIGFRYGATRPTPTPIHLMQPVEVTRIVQVPATVLVTVRVQATVEVTREVPAPYPVYIIETATPPTSGKG
jgi:hypothetical protein